MGVDSVYLSSENPRLPLRTEAELRRAVDNGILRESHFLEFKRLIPPGRSKNVELAKDLASFGVDGGVIVVGIGENEDGSLVLDPVELDGLAERVDQVAAFGIDPPLSVLTHRIRTEGDATRGYLVVHVPSSPLAPHAVDGRYMGRGDTTKRYLTDPEVLRLHERRLTRRVAGEDRVRQQFARDPLSENRRQAHLFVIAEPQTAPDDMLVPLLDAGHWQQFAVNLLHRAIYNQELNAHLQASNVSPFAPDMDTLQSFDLRASGFALTSAGIGPGRTMIERAVNDETVAELEVTNSGALHAYMSRLSDNIGDAQQQYFLDSAPVAYVRRMLALATEVSEKTGYFGVWTLGVGATGLRGLSSYLHYRRWQSDGPRYDEDEYVRATEATYSDLRDHPGLIAERLLGQLLRSFRVHGVFEAALSDDAKSGETQPGNDDEA